MNDAGRAIGQTLNYTGAGIYYAHTDHLNIALLSGHVVLPAMLILQGEVSWIILKLDGVTLEQ